VRTVRADRVRSSPPSLRSSPPELSFDIIDVRDGLLVCAAVLVSDVTIHGLLMVVLGDWYLRRNRDLAGLFREQSLLAIFIGSLMAGIGEELLFRGLDPGLGFLIAAGIVFGLLHHISGPLWPFTLWAVWQGLFFALAMLHFQRIGVTMIAHFLHDLVGFLVFRILINQRSPLISPPPSAS
jgi:membrane protease YdiL (CAAX protease family)